MRIFNSWTIVAAICLLTGAVAFADNQGCEDVSFNCQQREGHIGSQTFQIGCGPNTGNRMQGKGKIAGMIKGAGSTLSNGSKGYTGAMLKTDPDICTNCFIHVGGVGQGRDSLGCLTVEQDVFDKLAQCVGLDPNSASSELQKAKNDVDMKIVPSGYGGGGGGKSSGGSSTGSSR